jgi:hypothetical protein
VNAVLVLLDGVNSDLGMEDVSRAVDGSDATECLRDVSNSVVNVKIRYFSIDSTRFDEFAEFFNESS